MTRKRRYARFTSTVARKHFLDALAAGLPVTAACKKANWYQPGVYQLRKENAEFAEAWDLALEAGIGLLEQEALRRATIGRELPVVDGNGDIIRIERQPPSDTLLMFLLRAKKPEVYRETYRYDVTNSDNSLVSFAKAMNLLEDPRYAEGLPPPRVIDVTPEKLAAPTHGSNSTSSEHSEGAGEG